MKLLLDQGLPRGAVAILQSAGHQQILERGALDGRVVVTLDADFHAILALSGATQPSVLRVRVEGLDGPALARLIQAALATIGADLDAGAVATVDETRARVRRLPLI